MTTIEAMLSERQRVEYNEALALFGQSEIDRILESGLVYEVRHLVALRPGEHRRLSESEIDALIDRTCELFGLMREGLMSGSRVREYVLARQLLSVYIFRCGGRTMSAVTKIFKQSHCTLYHSIRSVDNTARDEVMRRAHNTFYMGVIDLISEKSLS